MDYNDKGVFPIQLTTSIAKLVNTMTSSLNAS